MALTLPTVQTDLNFYKALDDEKPYIYTYEHDPQTNFSQDTKPAVIHDIRGHEDEFTLDKNWISNLSARECREGFHGRRKDQDGILSRSRRSLESCHGCT